MRSIFDIARKPGRSGIVLLTAMFFVTLLSLLGFAFLTLVPTELFSALHETNRTQAYYLANGVTQGMATWMRTQEDLGVIPTSSMTGVASGDSNWPMSYSVTSTVVPNLVTTTLDSSGNPDGSWAETITMYSDVNTTAGYTPHTYKLHMDVQRNGMSKLVCDYILQQSTFAKYGFFVDQAPSGGYYPVGPSTTKGYGTYSGEFHINGPMPLYVQPDLFSGNYLPSVAPIKGLLTFVTPTSNTGNDGVAYQSSTVPFDGSGNELQVKTSAGTVGAYSLLASQGRQAIKQVPFVAMPMTGSDAAHQIMPIQSGSWFGRNVGSDVFPTQIPNGVNLNFIPGTTSMAGVYIEGSVFQMKLGVIPTATAFLTSYNPVSAMPTATTTINAGDPVTTIFEQAQVSPTATFPSYPTSTSQLTKLPGLTTPYTQIIETRDPSVIVTIPTGANITTVTSSTSRTSVLALLPTPAPASSTIVIRKAGTSQNPSLLDVYEIWPGYGNGVVFVDGNLGYSTDLQYNSSTAEQPAPMAKPNTSNTTVINTNAVPTTGVDHNNYNPATANTQGGLSGVNYGTERTISVNYKNDNLLRLNGSILRGDTLLGSAPPALTRRDGIGLVGFDVLIAKEMFGSPTYLYALLMAGRRDSLPAPNGTGTKGSVIYEDWATGTETNLNIYGSYIVENDVNWGSTANGWNPIFNWDAALASAPPPFFPSQSDYTIQAFKAY